MGANNWTQHSRCSLTKCKQGRRITSLDLCWFSGSWSTCLARIPGPSLQVCFPASWSLVHTSLCNYSSPALCLVTMTKSFCHGSQVGQKWCPLCTSVLTTPNYFLVFHVFENDCELLAFCKRAQGKTPWCGCALTLPYGLPGLGWVFVRESSSVTRTERSVSNLDKLPLKTEVKWRAFCMHEGRG